MKNNKGFTLVEILAVIIIIGILMIIAIPAVTKNISDSRATTFIDTANKFIDVAMADITALDYSVTNKDYTYYIPTKCLKTENNANESPYGKFVKSYVVVTYNKDTGKNDYYFTAIDETGHGILLTARENLTEDSIKTDLIDIDNKIGIGDREYVYIYSDSCNYTREKYPVTDSIPDNGTVDNTVIYPEGKNKSTVETGDLVKIGTEEFNVVKRDGKNLILLARYNLNVGDYPYGTATGKQDSHVRGFTGGSKYGHVKFASSNYWDGKVGTTYPGSYTQPNYPDVYDKNNSRCTIATYVEAYKTILEEMGASIKEARLLTYSEALELGCYEMDNIASCDPAPAFVRNTTYWLGSAEGKYYIYYIDINGAFFDINYDYSTIGNGVRPVIVI